MAVNQAQAPTETQPAAYDVAKLRQIFQSIDALSCPYNYNFHLHTVFSDGQLQPEELIEQASQIRLRGLAITDHHSVAGYRIAQAWLESQLDYQLESQLDYLQDDLQDDRQDHSGMSSSFPHLWTGVEITSQLLNTEVHILGYGFDPDRPSIISYLEGQSPKEDAAQADVVIRAIQQAGGIAVLAHPVRYRQPAFDLITAAVLAGIDGVEAYYSYNNSSPWVSSPDQSHQVKNLSDRYHLLNTCGTDTHGKDILRRI